MFLVKFDYHLSLAGITNAKFWFGKEVNFKCLSCVMIMLAYVLFPRLLKHCMKL